MTDAMDAETTAANTEADAATSEMSGDAHRSAIAEVEERMAVLAVTIREGMRDAASAVDPDLTPFGLKVIRLVARSGPIHASRVADQLLVERSVISRQVKQLAELGLIETTVDPDDGRARYLSLTAHGAERLSAAGLSGKTLLRNALVSWSTEDLEQFSGYLERLSRPE